MVTMIQTEQYLVQVFERTYYGEQFIAEKVVTGSQGVKEYLQSHTFIDRVIDEVLLSGEYYSKYDIIRVLGSNPDGSFDFYE